MLVSLSSLLYRPMFFKVRSVMHFRAEDTQVSAAPLLAPLIFLYTLFPVEDVAPLPLTPAALFRWWTGT